MDPRLLFLAKLLLAPLIIALALLILLGIIHFVLQLRKQRHLQQPPSSA